MVTSASTAASDAQRPGTDRSGTVRSGEIGHSESERVCRYTIGTLTNDRDQYDAMLASFKAGGFSDDICEFIFIDTTPADSPCAYAGLNRLLNDARGEIVILCHHDVRLMQDSRDILDQRLADLSDAHPDWAVAGNAGGIKPGQLAIRISDPHGENQKSTTLPARVTSLDENFLIIRRAKRVSFSANLSGFHLYGADICLIADILGYGCYVIDFHLRHLSPGNKDISFTRIEREFRAKWGNALRPRWIQTTCSLLHISGYSGGTTANTIAAALYQKLVRHLPNAFGWSKTHSPRSRASS